MSNDTCCNDVEFTCCTPETPYEAELISIVGVSLLVLVFVIGVVCFRCSRTRSTALISAFAPRSRSLHTPLVVASVETSTQPTDEMWDLGEEEINSFLLTIQPGGASGKEVAYNLHQLQKLGQRLRTRLHQLTDLTGNDFYLLQARLLQARCAYNSVFTPINEHWELSAMSVSGGSQHLST